MNLYNSFCEGLLDEEEFKSYKKKYDASLKQTEEAIKKQRTEIADMQAALENQQEWMKHFLVYKDREEIDRIMLTMLVKESVWIQRKGLPYIFGLQMNLNV